MKKLFFLTLLGLSVSAAAMPGPPHIITQIDYKKCINLNPGDHSEGNHDYEINLIKSPQSGVEARATVEVDGKTVDVVDIGVYFTGRNNDNGERTSVMAFRSKKISTDNFELIQDPDAEHNTFTLNISATDQNGKPYKAFAVTMMCNYTHKEFCSHGPGQCE